MKNPVKGLDKVITPRKAVAGAALSIGALVGAAALDALIALGMDAPALTMILTDAGANPAYVGLIVAAAGAIAKISMNAWKHRG